MGIFGKTVGVKRTWDVVRRLWKPDVITLDLEEELDSPAGEGPGPGVLAVRQDPVRQDVAHPLPDRGRGRRHRQRVPPCTRTSRVYPFPTPEVPLLTFLDTRGVDEPGYDPAEDIAAFDPRPT